MIKGWWGVFDLCLDELDWSSGNISDLFIKAHLTEMGHLWPSQEHSGRVNDE